MGLKRVLIANRGEIAIRIARAAAGLGMESVAVYPAIDENALHTRYADIQAPIPGDAVDAYLNLDALIAAAKDHNCDCIHPGYGFVSENAELAARCADAGITFVGPSSDVLTLFGNKVSARELAISLDIPVVPGTPEALPDAATAHKEAGRIGFPVMLKAAGGGGGRGMRMVPDADGLDEAFERCSSEAEAAFGDGTVFMEKFVVRPRHIEIQILSDGNGNTVHLFERDCSVQLRNQKVVEIAPAPDLDSNILDQLYSDAVKLAGSSGYANAGTVEFLVMPETGEYFFIECNPRIQVEHTVTESVTGVDLVEAQFAIAGGATLADLGLADQTQLSTRGFAIQARVVAQGAGTISAYKEPAGPGVRVDAAGYAGYAPPPQFDPLLGKVIGMSNSSRSFASAVDKTLAALNDFQIAGLPTNLNQLRLILNSETLRSGDARTTLLLEEPELMNAAAETSKPLELLEQTARTMGSASPVSAMASGFENEGLSVGSDERGAECPMAGTVVEVTVEPGAEVSIGDTLVVISAMKMETEVTAPCTGTVRDIMPLSSGDSVGAGQIVATIAQSADAKDEAELSAEHSWAPLLEETKILQALAKERLAPGSEDPGVVRQRSRGKLTCRERIELLLDDHTFKEVGSLAGFASYDEDGVIDAFTPANHVGGYGRIHQRPVIVCADDFTSRGGHADGAIGAKSGHL
ncbi:MAG: biotin carboxylase N-terminal domain-containing protein, partial [Pseudomonadota bacterium]